MSLLDEPEMVTERPIATQCHVFHFCVFHPPDPTTSSAILVVILNVCVVLFFVFL